MEATYSGFWMDDINSKLEAYIDFTSKNRPMISRISRRPFSRPRLYLALKNSLFLSLNGLEYLKNDADEVIYFVGVEAAKAYLREHGITEDEMEDMVFRKSVGTCFRCGDPLFLSDIPEYTCQCFRCDEDFYSIEQDVDL